MKRLFIDSESVGCMTRVLVITVPVCKNRRCGEAPGDRREIVGGRNVARGCMHLGTVRR
jgi:hypothetical protein